MKVKIICFSQTGNTRLIAEAVTTGLQEKKARVSLVNWIGVRKDSTEQVTGGCDLLGIAYPCFFYRAPFCMEEWVERFPKVKGRPYFLFATHSGLPGSMFRLIDDRLRRKGWVILDWQGFLSRCSFQLYCNLPALAPPFPNDLELAKARQFGQFQILKYTAYQAGRRNFLSRPNKAAKFWQEKAAGNTKQRMNAILPPFEMKAERCTQCGECINNCPDGAIAYNQNRIPEFRGNCTRCYHCARICPTEAIQNDWTAVSEQAIRNDWNHYPDWLKGWPELDILSTNHPIRKTRRSKKKE